MAGADSVSIRKTWIINKTGNLAAGIVSLSKGSLFRAYLDLNIDEFVQVALQN